MLETHHESPRPFQLASTTQTRVRAGGAPSRRPATKWPFNHDFDRAACDLKWRSRPGSDTPPPADFIGPDIRTSALGRMTNVVTPGTPFEPWVKFNLRKVLAKSFGITRGGKAVLVHLRFQPRALLCASASLREPSKTMLPLKRAVLPVRAVAVHVVAVNGICYKTAR